MKSVSSSQPQNEVDGAFLLEVVVGQSPVVFKLLPCEDESLLVDWDSFSVVNLGLQAFDAVALLDFHGHGLSCKGPDEDLHVCFDE